MELSNPIIDEQVNPNSEVVEVATVGTTLSEVETEPVITKELSERDLKIAYAKAMQERKQKIKQNKEMLGDMQLEVDYWKAQSDLLKYRFEKMDYYLKNIELEPKYLQAIEAQKLREENQTKQTSILE